MNSRERVLTAMGHERPDRTPCDIWARMEIFDALKEHFGTDDVREVKDKLGVDLEEIGCELHTERFESEANGIVGGTARPYSGARMIMHDERTFEDEWRVVRRIGRDGKYFEWISGPLMDADSVEAFEWPKTDDLPGADELRDELVGFKDKYFTVGIVDNPFKMAWQLRGLENLFMDYLSNQEFTEALLWRLTEFMTEGARRLARAGVDCVRINGDIAMQDRLMLRPDVWRAFDKKCLAAMVSEAKKVRDDLKVYFHSDGNLDDVMEDLIEIGFDMINPIQPECMDVHETKRRYGDRVTLFGTISVQQTLPFGSVDDVKAEVTDRIENCGYNGGLVICPSNVIELDTPLENVLALYETVRTSGDSS